MTTPDGKNSPITSYPDIEEMTYDQAIEETESILKELEQEQLPIDTILSKSRRVVALIEHCRTKMRAVSQEVDEILQSLRDAQ